MRRGTGFGRAAPFVGMTALTVAATLAAVIFVMPSVAQAVFDDPPDVFAPFEDANGIVQTARGFECTSPQNGNGGGNVCNQDNRFLLANFGFGSDSGAGNTQSCETCHQPQLGWSVTPSFLQAEFEANAGANEYFRVNDTAIDPFVCGVPAPTDSLPQIAAKVNACASSMTLDQKAAAFHLFTTLGIHRIALTLSSANDFSITADAASLKKFYASSTDPTGASNFPIPKGSDSQASCAAQGGGTPNLASCAPTISVYRRPLVTTNTFFDSSVLWDGRQTVCVEDIPPVTNPPTPPVPGQGTCSTAKGQVKAPLLQTQVQGAARTLLITVQPTASQAATVAHFMTGIFTAQTRDNRAGSLHVDGATGGPQFLANLSSGPIGPGPQQPPCTPLEEASTANSGAGNPPPTCTTGRGFNLYNAWFPDSLQNATTQQILNFCKSSDAQTDGDAESAARLKIACGQEIFNFHPLNDPVVGRNANNVPNARCTSCHSAQEVGTNPSTAFVLPYTPGGGIAQAPDLFVGGATDASTDTSCHAGSTDPFCQFLTFNLPKFKARTSLLPLYTLTCTSPANATCSTGASIQLTDPGQALINHSFNSRGGMKPPQLRDLAARAPYFHNGAAETLDDLVDFYNQNFSIGLTQKEHNELVAFLHAL